MDPQAPDRGLVLGALALQLGMVGRQQLSEAVQEWLTDPSVSAVQVLLERGHLSKADMARLEAVAEGQTSGDGNGHPSLLRTAPMLAAQTIGADRTQRSPEPSIGQTVREGDRFGDRRRLSSVGLTELNDSHQRFRLLRPHGKGGLGIVSVAHDAELDREVAIKEMRVEHLSDEAVQRFMMEARVTGQLDHPGIPPVYALGYFEDGRPFYVMRLIEGVTLRRAVDDFHKRYPPPDTSGQRSLELRKLLGAFVSVCHTLRYAHSRHVLHRDIKPSNIMLGNFGETLVLDWGLAKCREESLPYSDLEAKAHQSKRRNDDPTLTGTGSVLGTPHYMSPEQARGQWESVNVRSEVYSLGATLYTVLTGKIPFSGTTREAVLEQVRQGNCRRPKEVDPRIPAELDAICMKAMALQREDRFATAGELAGEIEHWLADEPISIYRETASRRWQRWFKSHQTALAALVALVATGMIALLVGAVAISYEHSSAKKLSREAQIQRTKAETNSEAARYFLGRFIALNYVDKLSNVSGNEQSRLALLDEAIAQLKKWALDNPEDSRYKLDLTEAFRQRAYLASLMHRPDQAWDDLSLALDIVEDMIRAPVTPLHTQLILTRLYTLNDMVDLIEQRYGPEATLEMLRSAQREADQLLQHDADEVARRVALYQLNVTLARQLSRLGRWTEAAELIDNAVSQFETMLTTLDEKTLDGSLHDGFETILLFACDARLVQSRIAYALEDADLTAACIERTEELCDRILEVTPGALHPLVVKLDTLALRAQMSQDRHSDEDALQEIRQIAEEIRGVVNHVPNNSRLLAAKAQAELCLAREELRSGTLPRAADAASNAIAVLESLCTTNDPPTERQIELAQAHRVQAEIALAQHDRSTAAAHCHVARVQLAAAASKQVDAQTLAAEMQRLEFIESHDCLGR